MAVHPPATASQERSEEAVAPEVADGAPPAAGKQERRRLDAWRLAPGVISFLLAAAYLIAAPRTPDLAGHIFRSELVGREGLAIWNGQWYGGHHTLSYSVLAPPLGWLIGPQLMGAISAVVATLCFERLAHRHFGARAARWGAIWFGVASATNLFTNRLPFALGVAFGMAALLALQRRRRLPALALGALSGLSSPVAGLFLCLAGVTYGLGARGSGARWKRVTGGALAAAALLPPLVVALAFPDEGYAPFEFKYWYPVAFSCLAWLALLPLRERTLRIGAALYLAGVTLAVLVPTQVGITSQRLGALVAGPVLLCAVYPRLRGRTLVPLTLVLCALAYWQWAAPVGDILKASDPVARASYFDPIREYFRLLPDQRRIEIPFTYGHWEGSEVAAEAPLARGWLRQLDTGRHPVFYNDGLNELTYASWLSENAVRYVALPDAKPDRSSYRERALIERGLPYLKPRARFDHWRIFEVTLPTPIVIPQGDANITLEQLRSDELLLRVRKPGDALVRVRWTPYWLAKGGCVEREGDWTRVTAHRGGFLRLVTRFSPERVVERGRRCNTG